jgi:hypothetical protein
MSGTGLKEARIILIAHSDFRLFFGQPMRRLPRYAVSSYNTANLRGSNP